MKLSLQSVSTILTLQMSAVALSLFLFHLPFRHLEFSD